MKSWWNSYKYRFVPWLFFNLKDRGCRIVSEHSTDFIVPHDVLCCKLLEYFTFLDKLPSATNYLNASYQYFGYALGIGPSIVDPNGNGILVKKGTVPFGSLVGIYPGLIYFPTDPVLLPSLGNSFLFRCQDGLLVDGKGTGLSGVLYRSCVRRLGPCYYSRDESDYTAYFTSDFDWLLDAKNAANRKTDSISKNFFAVGQFVNNGTSIYPANVTYQEVSLSYATVPPRIRRFLPCAYYSTEPQSHLRLVTLVATKELTVGEELLSSYFTFIS